MDCTSTGTGTGTGTDWQGYKVYPSARALLEMGLACREPRKGGWSIYPGYELTVYPGCEGPQEASDINEALDWVGGDQPASLTRAGRRKLAEMQEGVEVL